ncbi:MAG: hypothetical protein ACRDD8_15505 [Bacteroidales bacterium]
MARRKDDINIDAADEILNGGDSVVEPPVEETKDKVSQQKEVDENHKLTSLELIFCSTNKDEEFLYFDSQGGVFTERSPKYVLENCKKVKNPKYGSK